MKLADSSGARLDQTQLNQADFAARISTASP
ncbi:MAG: hypothetical protein IPK16_29760 [Anaerolineales bacterium]|nr:hypothetical protein [Anaerolineales bacterium]